MKFDHLVDVSFHNFVFNGKFDFVELGQTMAWLEQNFVEPDSKNDMGNGFYIWLFGNVEFHFENNKLYMIWCDYLSQIHLGKAIRFDKGILNNVAELNVTRVFNMLVNEGADLQIRRQSPHTLLIHVNRSGVTLWFEADEEQPGDPQNYMLMAFGLTHRDYDAIFQYSYWAGSYHDAATGFITASSPHLSVHKHSHPAASFSVYTLSALRHQ